VAATIALSLLVGNGRHDRVIADEVVRLALVPATPDKPMSFRDMMIVGLRARLESEIAFVDAVVLAVEEGRLPRQLVDQTYFWARQRSARSRDARLYRPITYFQIAMRLRAQKLGVQL
jgi:hypothetical protein